MFRGLGGLAVVALVAVSSLVALGAPGARYGNERDATPHARVVIDSIQIGVDARTPDALRTIVIADGRIVAITEPGSVVLGPGDRLIRGAGRYVVTGLTILLGGEIDLLDLRQHFVAGVTTAELPDAHKTRCIATLAAISSMRVPRVRLVDPDAQVDATATRIEVGAVADLIIRQIPGGDRPVPAEPSDDPLRLLITARDGVDPGGVLIVFPGELEVLGSLIERLRNGLDASLDALPSALNHFLSLRAPSLPQSRPHVLPAMARSLITIDALPRGVVWTWSDALPGGRQRLHTLVRLLEPFDAWAHVEEFVADVQAGDPLGSGRLTALTVALLELNSPGLRDRRGGDPSDLWSSPLPIERTVFTVDGEHIIRRPPPGTEADDGTQRQDSIPLGRGPVAVIVGGVPTARSASLFGAMSAVEPEGGGDPMGRPVSILHVGLEPTERGVGVRQALLRSSTQSLCLPNRPLDEGGDRVPSGRVMNGIELRIGSDGSGTRRSQPRQGLLGLESAERASPTRLWVDSMGTLRGLLEQTEFGVFAVIPDPPGVEPH